MKRRFSHKLLALTLALCMCLSLTVPAGASWLDLWDSWYGEAETAADDTAAYASVSQPFSSGTMNSKYFRIPAIVTLGDGTIVAAADARWNSNSDGYGIDSLVAVSTNHGGSWSYNWAAYLGKNQETGSSDKSYGTFIDPCLATDGENVYMLVDLFPCGYSNLNTGLDGNAFTNGHLRLSKGSAGTSESRYTYYLGDFVSANGAEVAYIYNQNNKVVDDYTVDRWFNLYQNGIEVSNLFYDDAAYQAYPAQYLYLVKSVDGGNSWSAPTLLDFRANGEIFYGTGTGSGIVTSNGTIVFPCYKAETIGTKYLCTSVIYSTDGGATWQRSADIGITNSDGVRYSSEAAITEVTLGGQSYLYLFPRNDLSGVQYYYVSADHGKTWGSAQKAGTANTPDSAMGAITYSRLIDGKPAVLLCSSTGSNRRTNGKIFVGLVQDDGSIQWKYTYSVNTGGYAYSDMTELADGSIGLLYEDNSGGIVFAKYDIATIAEGATIGGDSGSDGTTPGLPDLGGTADVEMTDEATGVSVTLPAGSSMTVTAGAGVSALEGKCSYNAYDISINSGAYTSSAKVTLPTTGLDTNNKALYGFVVNADGSIEKAENGALNSNGTYTFTAPHFSVVGVAEQDVVNAPSNGVTKVEQIELTVGSTDTKTVDGTVTVSTEGDRYIAAATTEEKSVGGTAATVEQVSMSSNGTYTGVLGCNGKYMTVDNGTIGVTDAPTNATVFTVTRFTNTSWQTRYRIEANGNYLICDGYWEPTPKISTSNSTEWQYTESNGFYYALFYSSYKLALDENAWALSTDATYKTHLYSVTPGTPGSTTTDITFTGTGEGTTDITVGDTVYTVTVKAREKTEEKSVNLENSLVLPSNARNAKLTVGGSYVSLSGSTITANAVGNAQVTFEYWNNGGKITDKITWNIHVVDTPVSSGTNKIVSDDDITYSSETVAYEGSVINGLMLSYSNTGTTGTTSFTVRAEDEAGNELSNVTWSSDDPTVATVDQNGTIKATGIGNCNVIATYADGTQTVIPVRVVHGNQQSKDTAFYFYVDGLYHTDLFIAVKSGETEDLHWTQVPEGYLVYTNLESTYTSSTTSGYMGGIFFATRPEDGYATTYMGHARGGNLLSELYYNYIGRSDDPEKPWNPSTEKSSNNYIYFYQYAINKGNLATHGYTQANFETLLKNGIEENDLDAACFYSYSGSSVGASMQFISDKLPTFHKTIASVTSQDGTETTYTDGMEIESGDTVNYDITITTYRPHETTFNSTSVGKYGTIVYTDVRLNDVLTGDVNKTITGMPNSTTSAGSFRVYPEEAVEGKYTYRATFTLNDESFDEVKDGTLTNTAELSYVYNAKYSIGTTSASADAAIQCTVKTLTFVVDFGLPVTLDCAQATANRNIQNATVSNGTVTVDGTKITYTPDTVFSQDGAYIALEMDGGKYSAVTIHPASNVLYEENFLTAASGNYADWSSVGTAASGSTQSSENQAPYGFDQAYTAMLGQSGSAYQVNLASGSNFISDPLTFTLSSATGLDVIGQCGPNTGTLFVALKNMTTNKTKTYVIYTDLQDAELGTIHQVPLAHIMDLDPAVQYEVSIRGGYVDLSGKSSVSAAGTFGSDSASALFQLYDIFAVMGLTDEEIENVEYIGFENAVSGVSTYAVDEVAAYADPADDAQTVTVDGIRVYYPTNRTSYVENEKNAVYTNVVDGAITGSFAAYVEGNESGTYTTANYEAVGGPNAEIYLPAGTGIVFKLADSSVTKAQISARAVSGAAKMNGQEISTNTELYYEVSVENGLVTIANNGDNMLALGNLKAACGVSELNAQEQQAAPAMVRMMMLAAPETPVDPEPVFVPDRLDVTVKSMPVIRNKVVTVTISASKDVAKLVVNGKTLQPTNSWMVKMGWSDTYTYVILETVKKSETKTYEVVAYNTDGVASAACTVQG